jgi:peptide/nickel transport system substrate-binding protein
MPSASTFLLFLLIPVSLLGSGLSQARGEEIRPSDARNDLTVCLPAYVECFDPTDHRSRITQLVLNNIFEALTARDQDLKVVPRLAESWRSPDPLTWEFKLRRGVRFHNGDAFSAHDVKFTFDRIITPGALNGRSSPRGELFEPVSHVVVVDDYTVRITTKRPWAILPLMLSLQEIVPERYLKSVGPEGFEEKPVGAGPFRLQSFQNGSRIVLTRFNDYCDPKPHPGIAERNPVQNLIFEVVPQKVDQIARLKRGEADLIFSVPPCSVDILKKTPGIAVQSHSATRCYFAEINCAKPPFTDRRIRQALNYSVDIHALVRHILAGYGKPLPTVLMPNGFAYNTALAPYPHDPQKARELLEAAGYPRNRPVVIHCNNEDREIGNILTLFLTRVGLSASLHVTASYRPMSFGAEAEWDLCVGSWGNSTLDPIDILQPKFKSDGKGNYSGYSNREVDRLMEEAERSSDMEHRAEAYKRAQAIIHEDAPMIFGYASEEFYGLRERVRNFHPSPTGMLHFKDVYLESEN